MILERIKLALRVKSSAFDFEINDLIQSCKNDLAIAGVKSIDEDNPLIIQAIKLYCRANFYIDNKEADRYTKSYILLKQSLSLSGDYNVD